MSAKAKLRLRHIEDAAKSKTANTTPQAATVKLFASPSLVSKKKSPASAERDPLLQADQAEYGSAVGEILRRHRIERDLSLQDIAQQLRIQRGYLDALENGNFDSLPGLTYAIGYVRSYAQLFDLDTATMITDFKAEAKKLQEPTQLSFPSPAPEGKVPGGALVFVGVFLAALSYGGWYYFSTSDTSISDLTPNVPDRLAFLLEEPAIDAPTTTESAPATQQATAVGVVTPAQASRKEPSAPTQSAPTQIAAASVQPEPVGEPATEATTTAPASQSDIPVAVSASETAPAAPETAAATSADTEIPVAPSNSEAVAAVEPAVETSAPAETASADSTALSSSAPEEPAAAEQIASVPASALKTGTAQIPDVPEMPRQEVATSGRSVAEAEAAAIDSRPKPVSAIAGPIIVISATDDSWVQVRGTDATPLLTRILRKGEQYKVPARTGLKLFTGNAGALKISVNGAEAPSLGPFGKIARNIPLDETLLTYTATN